MASYLSTDRWAQDKMCACACDHTSVPVSGPVEMCRFSSAVCTAISVLVVRTVWSAQHLAWWSAIAALPPVITTWVTLRWVLKGLQGGEKTHNAFLPSALMHGHSYAAKHQHPFPEKLPRDFTTINILQRLNRGLSHDLTGTERWHTPQAKWTKIMHPYWKDARSNCLKFSLLNLW